MQEKITPEQSTQRTGRGWMPLGVSVAFVMIVVFSLYMLNLMATIENQNQQLISMQDENQQLRSQVQTLTGEVTRKEEILSILASKRIEIVLMEGSNENRMSLGRVVWNPEKRMAILQVSNLPPTPANRNYELWVTDAKRTFTAGVFIVSDSGTHTFKLDSLTASDWKAIRSFVVSQELGDKAQRLTGERMLRGRK